MMELAVFTVGFVCGAAVLFLLILAYRGSSSRPASSPMDAEDIIMAVSAEIQAQLDRLAQVPAQFQAAKAMAVQTAQAEAAQNHADEVAALTTATDAVVASAS